jgi:hypothetical protein
MFNVLEENKTAHDGCVDVRVCVCMYVCNTFHVLEATDTAHDGCVDVYVCVRIGIVSHAPG